MSGIETQPSSIPVTVLIRQEFARQSGPQNQDHFSISLSRLRLPLKPEGAALILTLLLGDRVEDSKKPAHGGLWQCSALRIEIRGLLLKIGRSASRRGLFSPCLCGPVEALVKLFLACALSLVGWQLKFSWVNDFLRPGCLCCFEGSGRRIR